VYKDIEIYHWHGHWGSKLILHSMILLTIS
jgi:hypothetical protein